MKNRIIVVAPSLVSNTAPLADKCRYINQHFAGCAVTLLTHRHIDAENFKGMAVKPLFDCRLFDEKAYVNQHPLGKKKNKSLFSLAVISDALGLLGLPGAKLVYLFNALNSALKKIKNLSLQSLVGIGLCLRIPGEPY